MLAARLALLFSFPRTRVLSSSHLTSVAYPTAMSVSYQKGVS